jgi:hypothetical protein
MRTRYIEIGISLFLLVLFNFGNSTNISSVSASETQSTVTEVFADKIEVISPNSIFFTIHVTAGGNPVPSGQVTVYEETDAFYAATGEIYNGIGYVEWIPKAWTPTGWCTFIADYEGTSQYDASSGNTQVSVDDPVIPGNTETETFVVTNTEIAYPNETVDFDVTINIIDSVFPLFSGGYVYIFDITENIVLKRHDIVAVMDDTYTTTLTLTIPSWYTNGTHTIETRYSGSYNVDHATSSDSSVIDIINNNTAPIEENFTISMSGNTTTINRGLDTLHITATIDGDNPAGKIIQLYSYQDNGSISLLVDEDTMISRDYSYIFDPDSNYQEGSVLLELSLIDNITNETKATANISAIIIDPIIIYNTTISLDQDIYEAIMGDILNIPVYITSSSGDPITDGILYCYIRQNNVTIQELNASISNGYTSFDISTGDFYEGNFQLRFEWMGNETQTAATYDAQMNILKATAIFTSDISSNTIEYGTTTSWSAYVTTDLGTPITQVPIKFESSLTGFNWDHWGTIMTNDSGYVTIDITWLEESQVYYGNPGKYDIRISIDENNKIYTDENIHDLSVTKNQVILTLEDLIIPHLSSGIIQGTLTTSDGNPMSNIEIDLYWNITSLGSWIKINTVTTDEYGNYYQEVTPNKTPGYVGIEADYDGNTYYTSAVKNAILEIIDNPSEVEKIEITPAIIDLGDTILINVSANDIDSINSISAKVYNDSWSNTMILDYINGTYQKIIWCDTAFQIDTWTIDLIITDNLGIETTFANAGQFVIKDNPTPTVNYTVTPTTIPDGSSVEFEISATDTLGIKSIQIEIESTIYNLTDNITIIEDNILPTLKIEGLRGLRSSNNVARARETNVVYFSYSPSTTGSVPFIIYVEDNAGQIRQIYGNIMVEAVAPELSVLSMTSLNGTAPFSYALKLIATDGSGINNTWIYFNEEEYECEYNESENIWYFDILLAANDYIITIIGEDNLGIQATLDIGTLHVEAADFSVLYVSEILFDGESTEYTLQASTTLSHNNVSIIHNNETITETLDINGVLIGELQFYEAKTYIVQFSITDILGTQINHEYIFNISVKAPTIESIYPTTDVLATMRTPLTLDLEAIITDASGISSVILYVNNTEYALDNYFAVWFTSIELERGNYTLTLVATDIYGAETIYILGEITAEKTTTTTTEEPPKTSTKTTENEITTTDIIAAVTMVGATVATIAGAVLVKWKNKF